MITVSDYVRDAQNCTAENIPSKAPKNSPSGANIHELRSLQGYLDALGLRAEVSWYSSLTNISSPNTLQCSIDLTLYPQLPHLTSLFFLVGLELGDGSSCALAAGGRYDELVESFHVCFVLTSVSQCCGEAVSAEFAPQRCCMRLRAWFGMCYLLLYLSG